MIDIEQKYFDYANILAPYGVSLRYPNELALEECHAEYAVHVAYEFVVWAKEIIDDSF